MVSAFFAGELVALGDLERFVTINICEAVGVGELPIINEAVVATGALHVDAHENLRNVLRGLHLRDLAGVDCAAPEDAFGEAFGVFVRMDQLRYELVERFVGLQRAVEPLGDLFAAAVDVTGALVIVAQKIVPKRQPVLRVLFIVGEQTFDEPLTFVGAFNGHELFQVSW